jgi:hypothetical protein
MRLRRFGCKAQATASLAQRSLPPPRSSDRFLDHDPAPDNEPRILGAEWVDPDRASGLLPEFPVTPTILGPVGVVPHFTEVAM